MSDDTSPLVHLDPNAPIPSPSEWKRQFLRVLGLDFPNKTHPLLGIGELRRELRLGSTIQRVHLTLERNPYGSWAVEFDGRYRQIGHSLTDAWDLAVTAMIERAGYDPNGMSRPWTDEVLAKFIFQVNQIVLALPRGYDPIRYADFNPRFDFVFEPFSPHGDRVTIRARSDVGDVLGYWVTLSDVMMDRTENKTQVLEFELDYLAQALPYVGLPENLAKQEHTLRRAMCDNQMKEHNTGFIFSMPTVEVFEYRPSKTKGHWEGKTWIGDRVLTCNGRDVDDAPYKELFMRLFDVGVDAVEVHMPFMSGDWTVVAFSPDNRIAVNDKRLFFALEGARQEWVIAQKREERLRLPSTS